MGTSHVPYLVGINSEVLFVIFLLVDLIGF